MLHKDKNRLVVAGVIVVAMVAVVWFMLRGFSPVKDIVKFDESVPSFPILLATRDDSAAADRSDATDRTMTYRLTSVEPSILREENMGSIAANIFVSPFEVDGGLVYFVNPEGELTTYDLSTKKVSRVAVPGIEPVFGYLGDRSMRDFMLFDTVLIYLRGVCQEGRSCDLLMYDFATRKNTLLISRVEKLVSKEPWFTSLRLHGYTEGRSVSIISSWGDGAATGSDIFEVTFKDKNVKKMDSVSAAYVNDPRTENDLRDEERLNALRGKARQCGKLRADQRVAPVGDEYETQTTVSSGVRSASFSPTYIVGCLVPEVVR